MLETLERSWCADGSIVYTLSRDTELRTGTPRILVWLQKLLDMI